MKTHQNALTKFFDADLLKIDFSVDHIGSDSFSDVADTLLNHCTLKIKNGSYRITEIEFYLLSEMHNDQYTYAHPEQYEFGHWHFHRCRGTETYQEGKIKGIDLTLGNKDYPLGVLIRGIENLDNGEYIDGPSLVLDEILRQHQVKKVADLAKEDHLELFIELTRDPAELGVTSGPRVGLRVQKDWEQSECISYMFADYRYHIFPCKTKIDRHQFVLSYYKDNLTVTGAEGFGVRPVEIKKYVNYFQAGAKKRISELVENQEDSIEHWCELYGSHCATFPDERVSESELVAEREGVAPNFHVIIIGSLMGYARLIEKIKGPADNQDPADYFISSGSAAFLWTIHQKTIRPVLWKLLTAKPELGDGTIAPDQLYELFLSIRTLLKTLQLDKIHEENAASFIGNETFRRAIEPLVMFDLLLERFHDTSK